MASTPVRGESSAVSYERKTQSHQFHRKVGNIFNHCKKNLLKEVKGRTILDASPEEDGFYLDLQFPQGITERRIIIWLHMQMQK